MSAALRAARPELTGPEDTAEVATSLPRVSRRRRPRASRGTFIAINAAILVVGLLSLLVINTSLAQGAFEVSALQRDLRGLQEEQTALEEAIAQRSSTIALARAAERLGMVQVRRAPFLRLDDGRIIGRPRPVPDPMSEIVPGQDSASTTTGQGSSEGADARTSTTRPGRR